MTGKPHVPRRIRHFVAALGLLLLVVAPPALGRRDYNLRPTPSSDAIQCDALGGEYHPVPWRVPDQYFGGYHCLVYPFYTTWETSLPPLEPLDPSDPLVVAAARLCLTHQGATFAGIASFTYVGYACTWVL